MKRPDYHARLGRIIGSADARFRAVCDRPLEPDAALRALRRVAPEFSLNAERTKLVAGTETFEIARWSSSDALRYILWALEVGDGAASSISGVNPPPGWVPADRAIRIAEEVGREFGLPEKALPAFLMLEAARRTRDGVLELSSTAVNSLGYTGLYQFDRAGAAWDVAARWAARQGFPALAPFKPGVFDVRASSRAAAAYARANAETASRVSGVRLRLTGAVAYAMHNQGAGGFAKLLKYPVMTAALKGQSRDAIKTIRTALLDQGITANF